MFLVPFVEPVDDDPAPPRCEGLAEAAGANALTADVDERPVLGPVTPDGGRDDTTIGSVPENPKRVRRSGVEPRPERGGRLPRKIGLQLLRDLTKSLLGERRAGTHG
jgi:hypothetical protein